MLLAASATTPEARTWMWVAFLCAAIAMGSSWIDDESRSRTVYWAAWTAAAIFAALTLLPRGLGTSLMMFVFTIAMAAMAASFWGSQLKIGDRVLSLAVPNRGSSSVPQSNAGRPAATDRSGPLTDRAMWWVVALNLWLPAPIIICAGWTPLAISYVAAWTLLMGASGFFDARGRLRFARNQRVPAVVATVGTLPALGLPALSYTFGYLLGHRYPPARNGRHARHGE